MTAVATRRTPDRRTASIEWPKAMERRATNRRQRALRAMGRHSVDIAMWHLFIGLVALIVGTANGSRPLWPAPLVFYATSLGAALAAAHALLSRKRQPRIAAVLGVGATVFLRGTAYLIQAPDSGLRIAAAVGAYVITVGLVILVVAQAFGETLGGEHRWDG